MNTWLGVTFGQLLKPIYHRSLSSFRRSLKVTQSPFRYLATGLPVPVRQHSQSSGTWKGVAVLALRGWDPDILPDLDVPWSVRHFYMTCGWPLVLSIWWICGHLASQPLVVYKANFAGSSRTSMPSVQWIASGSWWFQCWRGWCHGLQHPSCFRLQRLAERWGCQISNTCKSTTRVDFCYISPELQQLLVQVSLDHGVWPDHAVLAGFFKGSNRDIPNYISILVCWTHGHLSILLLSWFPVPLVLAVRDVFPTPPPSPSHGVENYPPATGVPHMLWMEPAASHMGFIPACTSCHPWTSSESPRGPACAAGMDGLVHRWFLPLSPHAMAFSKCGRCPSWPHPPWGWYHALHCTGSQATEGSWSLTHWPWP